MVRGISADNSTPYGTVRRLGNNPNGRVMYSVIGANGEEVSKLSVAKADRDEFESAYRDIMESAPQIKSYVTNHSSPEELTKRKNTFRAIVASGGFIGASIPLFLLRKSKSVIKQIVSSVIGIVAGISVGFGVGMAVNSPPGSLKFAKASRKIASLDVKNYAEVGK